MDTHRVHEKTKGTPVNPDQIPNSDTITQIEEIDILATLGYAPELRRNRSFFTLLFQSLAIAPIPYGGGGPLTSAIMGGGELSIFVGWLIVLVLDECVALSLAELASRYLTLAGPYYWAFQIASCHRTVLSFITGWIWLMGNWSITLSVNFGFASLIAATISIYHPGFTLRAWQLLLIFFAICILTLVICASGNSFLPMVETVCAAWTTLSIFIILIAISVKANAGRYPIAYTLGHYDEGFSGWGGFTFFKGLLPAAYSFSAIGMISSMAEEVANPAVQLLRATSLWIPVGGLAGPFFIIPLCATLPPLDAVAAAPYSQALPYIFHIVMGSPGGSLGLMFLVLGMTMFFSISITTEASRCTWAFARDHAIPAWTFFSQVYPTLSIPLNALILVTIIQMLLGLVNLGSSSAFTAFVSVGVSALAVSYSIPIGVSLLWNKRNETCQAHFTVGNLLGRVVNMIALGWVGFEVVLFYILNILPTTPSAMNYASVVLIAFGFMSTIWYFVYAGNGKYDARLITIPELGLI